MNLKKNINKCKGSKCGDRFVVTTLTFLAKC